MSHLFIFCLLFPPKNVLFTITIKYIFAKEKEEKETNNARSHFTLSSYGGWYVYVVKFSIFQE